MRTEEQFKQILKEKKLSIFDECFKCKEDNKLIDGLCCKCWIKEEEKQILNELSLNTGTEQYFKIPFSSFVYTDGINNLIEKCKCWWLISDIGILLQCEKKYNKDFLILTIEVNKDKSAVITLKEDTNEKPIYTKKLDYTDFCLSKYEFFIINKVMLLKSEY